MRERTTSNWLLPRRSGAIGLFMGELINLKRARKRRTKIEADKAAELNRVKFGRTKSQRDIETAKADHAAKTLDQHKLPREDAT